MKAIKVLSLGLVFILSLTLSSCNSKAHANEKKSVKIEKSSCAGCSETQKTECGEKEAKKAEAKTGCCESKSSACNDEKATKTCCNKEKEACESKCNDDKTCQDACAEKAEKKCCGSKE